MPRRRLGRLASVVPASPLNTSSEASSSRHSESEDCRCGTTSARIPISSPRVFTRAGTLAGGVVLVGAFGSIVIVAARIDPELVGRLMLVPFPVEHPARRQADDSAVVGLLELVAVRLIVEKVSEVGKEIQPVLDRVYIHVKHSAVLEGLVPVERQAVARGPAAVGRIDRAE